MSGNEIKVTKDYYKDNAIYGLIGIDYFNSQLNIDKEMQENIKRGKKEKKDEKRGNRLWGVE